MSETYGWVFPGENGGKYRMACYSSDCYCPIHGDKLICPTCEGKRGGKKTAKLYKGKHAEWGKLGGRPKKKAKPRLPKK